MSEIFCSLQLSNTKIINIYRSSWSLPEWLILKLCILSGASEAELLEAKPKIGNPVKVIYWTCALSEKGCKTKKGQRKKAKHMQPVPDARLCLFSPGVTETRSPESRYVCLFHLIRRGRTYKLWNVNRPSSQPWEEGLGTVAITSTIVTAAANQGQNTWIRTDFQSKLQYNLYSRVWVLNHLLPVRVQMHHSCKQAFWKFGLML